MQHHCLLQRRVSIQNRYNALNTRRRQTIWQQSHWERTDMELSALPRFAIEGILVVQAEHATTADDTQRIPTHAVLAASSAEDATHLCQQQVLEAVGLAPASIVWWDTLTVEQA